MILTIRTDNEYAEVGLYKMNTRMFYHKWHASRRLAETILTEIQTLLDSNNGVSLQSVKGIIIYSGPGSFTGLRIGLSVANALTYSLDVVAVGVTGDLWIDEGLKKIARANNGTYIYPVYGSEPYITSQKK